MSRREEYEQKAEAILTPIVESKGFELVDVEYVKEAGTWYLRGYIDKPGGITVNDCEDVSRAISWMSRISSKTAILWRSVLRDLTGLLRKRKTLREALASWWRSVPTGRSRNRKNSAVF